jgi:nucleotide-binding universal stress UspA family protein
MRDFSPREILCLVDLSPASPAVLSWARLFAELFRSQVEIFHVVWPPTEGDEMRAMELRGQLDNVTHAALGPGISHRIVVGEGHPVKVVFQRIESHPPEFIVLGSHGYDGMARVLLGSVAENVVRMARCPMLVVKGEELPAEKRRLARLLCPVDLSDFSRQVCELAAGLSEKLEAELAVALVTEAKAAQGAEQRLRDWIPPRTQERAKVVAMQGEPAERIIAYTRDNSVDLVVLGAEHRPFLEYATLGRTTERVVRYGPSSVLLVAQ